MARRPQGQGPNPYQEIWEVVLFAFWRKFSRQGVLHRTAFLAAVTVADRAAKAAHKIWHGRSIRFGQKGLDLDQAATKLESQVRLGAPVEIAARALAISRAKGFRLQKRALELRRKHGGRNPFAPGEFQFPVNTITALADREFQSNPLQDDEWNFWLLWYRDKHKRIHWKLASRRTELMHWFRPGKS